MPKLPLKILGTGLTLAILVTPFDWKYKLPVASVLMYPSIAEEIKKYVKQGEGNEKLKALNVAIAEAEGDLATLNRQLSGTKEAAQQQAQLIINRATEEAEKKKKHLESKIQAQQESVNNQKSKLQKFEKVIHQERQTLEQAKKVHTLKVQQDAKKAKEQAGVQAQKAHAKLAHQLADREARLAKRHAELEKMKFELETSQVSAQALIDQQTALLEAEKSKAQLHIENEELRLEKEADELVKKVEAQGYAKAHERHAKEVEEAAFKKAQPFIKENEILQEKVKQLVERLSHAMEEIHKLEKPEVPKGSNIWDFIARETIQYCYEAGHIMDIINCGVDTNDSKGVFIQVSIRHPESTTVKQINQLLRSWAVTRYIAEEDFPALRVSGQSGYVFLVKNAHEFWGTMPGSESANTTATHAPDIVKHLYTPIDQEENLHQFKEKLVEQAHRESMLTFIEPYPDEFLPCPTTATTPEIAEQEVQWVEYFYYWREKATLNRNPCLRNKDTLAKRVWGVMPNGTTKKYLRDRLAKILEMIGTPSIN